MAQDSYKLRGEGANKDIIRRLRDEIKKLESQLERLLADETPHRFSLMKTYRTMIDSRQDILNQMQDM